MKALTVDAYWTWAIASGKKRVENRTWRTHYRGPLAIHAGRNTSRDNATIEAIRRIDPSALATPAQIDHIRGCVVAVCELVDVELLSLPAKLLVDVDSWAVGPYCWRLENVRRLNWACPEIGKQGLWDWGANEMESIVGLYPH